MTYTKKATCRFDVASWSEKAYVDIDEGAGTTAGDMYYPKRGLTHAEVGYTYTGEVEGSSTLAYLIAYKADAAPVLGSNSSPAPSPDRRAPACSSTPAPRTRDR